MSKTVGWVMGIAASVALTASAQAAVVSNEHLSVNASPVAFVATKSTAPSAASILAATSASPVAISVVEANASKKAAKASKKAAKNAAKAAKKSAKKSSVSTKKFSAVLASPAFANGIAAFPPSSAPAKFTSVAKPSDVSIDANTLATPLPAGLPLLITGLVALGAAARRRKVA